MPSRTALAALQAASGVAAPSRQSRPSLRTDMHGRVLPTRENIAALLQQAGGAGPGAWLSRAGGLHVRTGAPTDPDDDARLYQDRHKDDPCPDCDGALWVQVQREIQPRLTTYGRNGEQFDVTAHLCVRCGHFREVDRVKTGETVSRPRVMP